ncbi:MAG: phosphopyruvate hydratase [Candidatus Levyibacteriota bacterium]
MKITDIKALEILDSRGNPTVRTFLQTEDNSWHVGSVPSGASTGSNEVLELRDNDEKRYGGKGVQKAVENVNTKIKDLVKDQETDPKEIDKKMLELDGTGDKSNLGANAILSVSMAVTHAAAHSSHLPLWQYVRQYFFPNLNNLEANKFPQLMVNIVNGGKHAGWNFDLQEFMVVPVSATPSESIRVASEVFHSLGKLLKEKNLSTLVGDEGGYSPALGSNEEVLDTITEAAKRAGYERGKDYRLSLDCAASEFFEDGKYIFKKANKTLNGEELRNYYKELGQKYGILSFEDPFDEDDWDSWKAFQETSGSEFTLIGDDLFTTNPERIKHGIEMKAANGVLIKLNQIGTVSETAEAIRLGKDAGWKIAVSHRSGETEDNFIADLAYASNADFIKSGSMSRSERLSKYNRLLEIEKGI